MKQVRKRRIRIIRGQKEEEEMGKRRIIKRR